MVSINYNEAWYRGRPVYNRLPLSGYQDNSAVDAITKPIDLKLMSVKGTLEALAEALDPVNCPVGYLDYVAYLNGFSGRYWDALWTNEVKRQLVTDARYIWANRGKAEIVSKVLTIHGITHDVWRTGSLTLPFTLTATFSTPQMLTYIRLPLSYLRASTQWREAERTRKNFLHCGIKTRVVYDKFYLGFSKLGDPLFTRGIMT
jgi:phage tail P2-like protein